MARFKLKNAVMVQTETITQDMYANIQPEAEKIATEMLCPIQEPVTFGPKELNSEEREQLY